MRISIEFNCDTAAFDKGPNLDPPTAIAESQRILRILAQKFERWIPGVMLDDHEGHSALTGPITDSNGNTVGTFKLSDGNPVDPEL